jgi:asparagine synthase (glutamine-hydrolysing)
MCGIAGFVGLGDQADLQAMTDALAHRGPDGQGIVIEPTERLFWGIGGWRS